DEAMNSLMPPGFRDFPATLKHMPLFEAVENIISFFSLSECEWNGPYINTFQDNVLAFIAQGNPSTGSFLDWWEISGQNRSVVLPGNQDAMRILTIHKSKGLEFRVVILPFIGWNLEHSSTHQPLLWVKPETSPFNELGIVPVRCSKDLCNTIFEEHYTNERYSVHLDNLNLLYVALTRAKDVMFAFSVSNSGTNSVASVLQEAFISGNSSGKSPDLKSMFNPENNVFEYGVIPVISRVPQEDSGVRSSGYHVNKSMGSLRLKLHGENYFAAGEKSLREKINYGKLMHEVFEGISSANDIQAAVKKLVLEGKLPEAEAGEMTGKIQALISGSVVAEWFSEENKVLKETGILLTSGNIRRPDRVIFRNGRTTVIDFKFGKENERYAEQVNLYRNLLFEMGYENIDAFLWYVDQNKVVAV
ncbi:MAG TPA: 3'-5' exonuclease, partial [Bacteroidales bacterium]|nr:3'-5' exonuclease [Bacteroidales bacterium]